MEETSFEFLFPGEDEVIVRYSRGAILKLDGPVRGVTIACLSGTAWVTQLGDARDYIVRAPREFAACREGQILVQVLADARIALRLRDRRPGRLRLSMRSGSWNPATAPPTRWGLRFLPCRR